MGFFDSIKDIYDDIEDEVKRTASSVEAEWNRSDLFRAAVIAPAAIVAAPAVLPVLGGAVEGIAGVGSSILGVGGGALPLSPAGLPYIPDSMLPPELKPSVIGGILGDVVNAVPGAIKTLANVLPEIQDIFGGDSETQDKPSGDSGGDSAEIPQSTTPTSTQPIIIQGGQGARPVAGSYTTASGSSNLALYAVLGVAAYFLLR